MIESIAPINSELANEAISQPVSNKFGFADLLVSQINETSEKIRVADNAVAKAALGQNQNLHQVMFQLEAARVQMELVVQVRNRLLEGYQQVMQMRI